MEREVRGQESQLLRMLELSKMPTHAATITKFLDSYHDC